MKEKINFLISILAFLISVFSFYQSYQANRKQYYTAIESKQVEEMVNLVSYIEDTPFYIEFYDVDKFGNPAGYHHTNMTLFEMTYLPQDSLMDNATIYFMEGEKYPITFEQYVRNPLLPKEIADILYKYCSSLVST